MLISEYCTKIRCIWEELDSMSEFPMITVVTNEITTLFTTLGKQQ